MQQFDAIFFIGPQGSGKGTQARMLAEALGFYYWEMGGILRNIATEDTDLGKRAKEMLDSGILFPDAFLLEIVKSKLDELPKDKGLIFDGIPRRLGQANFLMDYLQSTGRSKFLTLFIDLPKEDSIERLLLRAEKEGRKDDTREAIETRLTYYYNDTLPVLDYLREHTIFATIDGTPPVEAVTAQIENVISAQTNI